MVRGGREEEWWEGRDSGGRRVVRGREDERK